MKVSELLYMLSKQSPDAEVFMSLSDSRHAIVKAQSIETRDDIVIVRDCVTIHAQQPTMLNGFEYETLARYVAKQRRRKKG